VIPVLIGLTTVALLAAGVLRLRRRYLVATVRGRSMEPALRAGDRLLVRRASLHEVRTGDVVVLRDHTPGPERRGAWLVKRVCALPGEPVPRARVPMLAGVPERVVPAGSLVVLGDNAAESLDSRQLGYVDADRLVGAAVRRLST